MLQAVDRIIHA